MLRPVSMRFIVACEDMVEYVVTCENEVDCVSCEDEVDFVVTCEYKVDFVVTCEDEVEYVVTCEYEVDFVVTYKKAVDCVVTCQDEVDSVACDGEGGHHDEVDEPDLGLGNHCVLPVHVQKFLTQKPTVYARATLIHITII